MTFLGVNIGGTNCSVVLATAGGEIIARQVFATMRCAESVKRLKELAGKLVRKDTVAAGISCGGPLDVEKGLILSPPNLPGWDKVRIVEEIGQATGKQAFLMNDANAGALSEWYLAANGECSPLVFLTCGTGMGAGILIDGKLLDGASGNAGEVGHMRLTHDGPVGFGKNGSFEGWCSGGGFEQYAKVTAKQAAELAQQGSKEHIELFAEFGSKLGQGLAFIIDVINPQRIALGGIFMRCESLIRPSMEQVLQLECLATSLAACEIVAANSGEMIGDYAAVAVARYCSDADPLDQLTRRFGQLWSCRADILAAADLICESYRNGAKLLLCGNGGSMADCEHIAGELLKSFRKRRPIKEPWAEPLDTNLKGVWLVAMEAGKRLIAAKKPGSIVNTASILGLRVAISQSSYATSKAAVIQLTKSLALEWCRKDIRVNALCPGYFITGINADYFSGDHGKAYIANMPARRTGNLAELTAPFLLLASDAGSFINGVALPVDGAHSIGNV